MPTQPNMKERKGEPFRSLFTQLSDRRVEVKQRCRAILQTRAEELRCTTQADARRLTNVDSTLSASSPDQSHRSRLASGAQGEARQRPLPERLHTGISGLI